jgi:hypothetical protein
MLSGPARPMSVLRLGRASRQPYSRSALLTAAPAVNGVNAYDAGYVAQFGFKGANRRAIIHTRAEGITGVTGKNGWCIHWALGVPLNWSIGVDVIPRGTSVIVATRCVVGLWLRS